MVELPPSASAQSTVCRISTIVFFLYAVSERGLMRVLYYTILYYTNK